MWHKETLAAGHGWTSLKVVIVEPCLTGLETRRVGRSLPRTDWPREPARPVSELGLNMSVRRVIQFIL